MRLSVLSVLLAAGILPLAACAVRSAEDARPWEKTGTKAGEEITGPDGGRMVWVPAGEFVMGSPEGKGDDDEHPAHRVRITGGFWLGKCTVTNAQYRTYLRKTGLSLPPEYDQGDDHPAVGMGEQEAELYCYHYGLSLPTEAEWEYAARGPEGREYPWGNQWNPKKCCNGLNQGPHGKAFPVGSFPEGSSWCGALDMAGNVWQWCTDLYAAKYYETSRATDPRGPSRTRYVFLPSDLDDQKELCNVLRGGSWGSPFQEPAKLCRSADRAHLFITLTGEVDWGFRCVARPKTP